MAPIDLKKTRELFESSTDFTVGIEEEFSLLDPGSYDDVHRFEEIRDLAVDDPVLSDSLVGELISSEVEIRSGKGASFHDAVKRQADCRSSLYELAERLGIKLGATGVHPWASWYEQRIIDDPYYKQVEDRLQYVAWRNSTFGVHAHVGVRGPDRAIAVCDHLRSILPELLALSCSSPYLDGHLTGLHSARSQIFTRSFPRCAVPDAFGSWDEYAKFIDFLVRSNSVSQHAQLWWSVRVNHAYGTVEVRICDAQIRGDESIALVALMVACVAQAARDYDEGSLEGPQERRLIDENLWRSIRYGLGGSLIKLPDAENRPAAQAVEEIIEWTEPARKELELDSSIKPIECMLDAGNGAQRQIKRHQEGWSAEEVFAETVKETGETYFG